MKDAARADSCPPSAVSHGVGLAGLVGLGAWILIARHFGMNGPHAGIAAVLFCAAPMLLWTLLVDKAHRRASTGLNWSSPAPFRETRDGSIVKLVGLWTTWGLIAVFYLCGDWYWRNDYRYAMNLLMTVAPALVVVSIPYVFWLDRYVVNPRDGAFAFGQWLMGVADRDPSAGAIADHARSWLVKAFFLAFMLSIAPGNFAGVVDWRTHDLWMNPVNLAGFLITLMFAVDVAFATAGYVLTMRPLDAHIRSANPLLSGWIAALICYPPFVLMGPGGPLFYEADTREWSFWLAGHPALLWLWGGLLVALTGFYAWATVAFGLRFSNLTHRGILTHGPYRLTKHPAYLAKNAFWWLSAMPFLVTTGSLETAVRNTLLILATNAVYYWRARTEEAHLMADPTYQAYAAWMRRHAIAPRLASIMFGRRQKVQDFAPAE